MTKNPRDIIREPVVSEKSYDQVEDYNTYTFVVDPRASKTEIKQAVQSIFGVKVISVNTMTRKGKRKRTGWVYGKRADTKRAFRIGQQLESGSVGLNVVQPHMEAPFGGFKMSGVGRDRGPYGIEAYSELQSLTWIG